MCAFELDHISKIDIVCGLFGECDLDVGRITFCEEKVNLAVVLSVKFCWLSFW